MTEQIKNVRYNAMDIATIGGFVNVTGGCRNSCKDVYFIRVQGYSREILKEVEYMDRQLTERMHRGNGIYRRISGLPAIKNPEDAGYYADCYERWVQSGRKEIYTKRYTKDSLPLPFALAEACGKVVSVYHRDTAANASIEKNMVVKLLFWLDWMAGDWAARWDVRKSVKIAAEKKKKKQEYFFFYFLTLIGCDVLLIQSKADIAADIEGLGLSKKLALGSFNGRGDIPPFEVRTVQKPIEPAQSVRSAESVKKTESGVENTGLIRMSIPRRPSSGKARAGHEQPGTGIQAGMPQIPSAPAGERREKSYEELAQLAASVVLIAVHNRTGDVIGTGSGIMVGKKGYILTNNHGASGGVFYSVKIENDDQIYETQEVIKYHSVLDLALIRIPRELKPIPVYNGSKKLVRGQRVVAIGSPLGLFNSVSDGIVSGFRVIDQVDMIQFTAPTSHGSSGGALLNMYGEVIGISTAGIVEGQNINLAVGYEDINVFIRGFV